MKRAIFSNSNESMFKIDLNELKPRTWWWWRSASSHLVFLVGCGSSNDFINNYFASDYGDILPVCII